MKKYLKLTLFINSLILCFSVSAIPADTLKHKTSIWLGLNYGISAYNSLELGKGTGVGSKYTVNSKPKSFYEICFSLNRKNNNFSLGVSLIQSSFSGKPYSMGAGRYNGLRYQYYYNIYQSINYNVYYISLGYGRNIQLSKKHLIRPSINVFVPLLYKYKIDNNYDQQQSYDTTLFSLTKNASNNNTNSGYFPRLNIGLSYQYSPIDKIGIVIGVSGLYAISFAPNIPDPVDYSSTFSNSNNYSYIAYDIRKQFVLLTSIGVNFKLN